MWKQKTELTEVDSPELEQAVRDENEASLDPATELPAPAAEEELAAGQAEAGVAEEATEQTELGQLKAERDQLLDRLARLQAEFENARKRAERERAEFREFVTGQAIEQFLPVLDNFELALKSTGSAHQLRSGVNLIVKQMEEILDKMQVKAVPAVGEAFDPHIHEAMGTVERDDVPDQHVAEEVRRGYKIRDRLLRPALVRVAHNPKQVSE
ncbi:MAG: nucleotide exchange factor GrpE [Terracidiphilus sp.]|jgi:molecular chaperone GrpE